jgi:G:T/U-mismatch repair DNA glycosylase
MRILTFALLLPLGCIDTRASALPQHAIAVSELEAKADQALRQEQCFRYAELVSRMTDIARLQFSTGDSAAGEQTLSFVRQNVTKLQASIGDDTKKLKAAETLMQHTAFRLEGILHEAPYDNRDALEMTLKQVKNVQTQLMMEVFKK